MDRRKAEIRASSERLKVECEVVVDLLKKILHKDTESVTSIENLTGKQILAKTKDFLEISQFQHDALQKVLEVGLELEVFLSHTKDADVDVATTTTLFISEINTNIKLEGSNVNSESEYPQEAPKVTTQCDGSCQAKSDDPCRANSDNSCQANSDNSCEAKSDASCQAKREEFVVSHTEETKLNIKYESMQVQTSSESNVNEDRPFNFTNDVQTMTADIEEDIKVFDELIHNSEEIDENIPEKDNIQEIEVKKFADDQDIVTSNMCAEQAASKEDAIIYENSSNCVKSESSDYPDETDKDDNKKTSSLDSGDEVVVENTEISEQVQTLHEKLKSKKLLSRKDRYLQNLPKPNVPDLTFKPSSKIVDSLDTFMSCKDSSSSSSSIPKEGKKKKKRSESTMPKEEKIEILKVPHLTLQECPAPYVGMLCVVSKAEHPSEIYISILDDNITIIDCLGLQISDLYDSTRCPFENKEDAKEKLGKYCVAYIEEYKIWYRAEILNWHLKGKSYLADIVTVQLVDYGHVHDVSYKNLRQLIVDFCHIPKYAIKCHLAALYPPTSTPDNLLEVWPVESLRIFQNIFLNVSQTAYKVIYVDDTKHSWAIDLIEEKEKDENLSIGQQLIDMGAAVEILHDPTQVIKNKFCINQLQTAQGFHGISTTMCEEQKLERYFNNEQSNKEPSNLDEAMVNYKANDEARTCRFALPNGTCFKGSRCKLDHQPLRRDGVTTDKQSMYKSAFNELVLPRSGDHIFLQVTNVININTFYACQVERMNNASYSAGLIRLLKLMNKEDTVQKYKCLKIIPTRGEIVIVKSWNGTWYRAQVLEVFDATDRNEEVIQVFIVDFGELIDVTMDDLRQIIPDYLHLPFQAILCRLYNVNPVNNVDEMAAKEYFESNFLCQCFEAKIMYASSSILEVLLTKCDGEDVGQQIIDDEFGEPRTEYFFPQESEKLLVD